MNATPTITKTAAQTATLLAAYRKNEEGNHHAENTAFLAAHFGTREDVAIAQAFIEVRDKLQGLPQNEAFRALQYEIQSRCWAVLVFHCEQHGIPIR